MTTLLRNIGFHWLCLMVLGLSSACFDGDGVGNNGGYVGGDCRDNGDCDEICLRGGAFPGGTCSVECRDDGDCPSYTYCVEKEGGVCLLSCDRPSDCRDEYNCKGEKNKGRGGESLVCIK